MDELGKELGKGREGASPGEPEPERGFEPEPVTKGSYQTRLQYRHSKWEIVAERSGKHEPDAMAKRLIGLTCVWGKDGFARWGKVGLRGRFLV